MSQDLNPVDPSPSPFDGKRHEDGDGEFWYGRELMGLMGYARWDAFEAVIHQAMRSLAIVQGEGLVSSNFLHVTNRERAGITGNTAGDWRLTRFAAYLTAMAGDDTKKEVAEARVYFAVKTREAEVAPILRREYTRLELIDMAREAEVARIAAEEERDRAVGLAAERGRELERAAPRVEYMDAFVSPLEDASLIRDFAKQLGVTEIELRNWLQGPAPHKLIYKASGTGDWKPYADYGMGGKGWFDLRDHPELERRYNRQMPQTLYITAVGKAAIRRLVMKYPIRPTNLDETWNGGTDV